MGRVTGRRVTGIKRGSKTVLLRDYIEKLYEAKNSHIQKCNSGFFTLQPYWESKRWTNLENKLHAPKDMLNYLKGFDDKDAFEEYFNENILKDHNSPRTQAKHNRNILKVHSIPRTQAKHRGHR